MRSLLHASDATLLSLKPGGWCTGTLTRCFRWDATCWTPSRAGQRADRYGSASAWLTCYPSWSHTGFLNPLHICPNKFSLSVTRAARRELLTRLAVYELDLVLSDSPIGPDVEVRAFNHLLGECGVSIFGAKDLATKYRYRFPGRSMAHHSSSPRATHRFGALEHWFDSEDIRPSLFGEFEDSALLKVLGQAGIGLFAAPTVIEKEVQCQYNGTVVGRLESVRERFYTISVEKKSQTSSGPGHRRRGSQMTLECGIRDASLILGEDVRFETLHVDRPAGAFLVRPP